MSVRIFEWRFRDPRTEMLYVADHPASGEAAPAAAIGAHLTRSARRSREREARGRSGRPAAFKQRFKFCRLAASVEDVDRDSVRALKYDIELEGDEWADLVEWVRKEWESYRRVDMVAYETGAPLQDVVAILEVLGERGEAARGEG